jgi:hypothetical protein
LLKSVKITKNKSGISFNNIDLKRFNSFFISIFWRASVSSNNDVFSKVYLPDSRANEVRICLLKNKKISPSLIGVKASRLIDKTPNGLSATSIKNIIISPFNRNLGHNFSFCFLIEGFFIEVFFPRLKLKERNRHGVLNQNKKILFTPFLHIFDVPELLDLMVSGCGKHLEGKSKVK